MLMRDDRAGSVHRLRAAPVDVPVSVLGEGPLWDHRADVLWWVDITSSLVHRYAPAGGRHTTFDVGEHVGAAGLRRGGGLVLAVQRGFAALDPATGAVSNLADVPALGADRRMNDGACDPAGGFWAGSVAYDEREGGGALYRLTPDREVVAVLEGVTCSNGIDWDLDRGRMLYVDSGTGRVDAFAFDPASLALGRRSTFVTVPPGEGTPDGLVLDALGGAWVALWDGGQVRRYAPEGHVTHVVELDAQRPTKCALGGPDLRDLYVTSADGDGDGAGALFRVRVDAPGRAAWEFAG